MNLDVKILDFKASCDTMDVFSPGIPEPIFHAEQIPKNVMKA